MTYEVRFSPPALRAYQKLDSPLKTQIQRGIASLQVQPLTAPQVKRLKGRLREYYRYRAGDYRIIYTVSHTERVVYVDYLQHRKDVYRRFE